MAVIQKIRDKYAKLTGGLIVVALIGFILMDYGKGSSNRSTTIGEIEGRKIDMSEYEARITEQENQLKQRNPNQEIDDNTQAEIRDQVWNEMVNEELLKNINERLGITITQREMNDLLTGPNPDPQVRQAFTDPNTGQFNPQEVSARIQQIKHDPKMKDQWEAFENGIRQRHFIGKFAALVNEGLYVPKFVIDNQAAARSTSANIRFVRVPYTAIPDAQVKVSDADITQYVQAHQAMFQVKKPFRSIEYVSFKVVPSPDDSSKVLQALAGIKNDFVSTTDVEGFVNHNSEHPAPPAYYTKEQLKGLANVDEIMNAPVSSIVGPFYDGGSYVLAKVLEKKALPDSVKSRHILVVSTNGANQVLSDTDAKARIDSAIALLKSGVPFDSVAQRYSDDPQSKKDGNEGETFTLAQESGVAQAYGQDFSNFIFNEKAGSGKLIKVSNDNYSGYNYVEIISQSEPISVSKLAFISKDLAPGKATYDNIYAQASQFVAKAGNGGDFDKTAQAQGVTIAQADGLDENSFQVNGLGASRDLVKWAYSARVGDVSPIYTVNGNYIVAKLKNIQPAGLAVITDRSRPMLAAYVMKDKKARIIMEKYKNAPATLDNVAASEKQTVATADSLIFAQSFAPGIGNEPKVIGYAFYKEFKENTASPAIPGNEGVYFISVTSRQAVSTPTGADINNEKKMMEMRLQRNAMPAIMNSITESADVEDKRGKLY